MVGSVSPTGGGTGGSSACGRERVFRLRASYFPVMESSQRSPGLRPRTRGSHPEGTLGGKSTGAGADLWLCLLSPPAAALRWLVWAFSIPCLAARLAWQQSRGAVFSGARSGSVRRGRCPHRPVSGARRSTRDAEDSVPYGQIPWPLVGAAFGRPYIGIGRNPSGPRTQNPSIPLIRIAKRWRGKAFPLPGGRFPLSGGNVAQRQKG